MKRAYYIFPFICIFLVGCGIVNNTGNYDSTVEQIEKEKDTNSSLEDNQKSKETETKDKDQDVKDEKILFC